jgi:3-dehydroquinate synthase
LREHERTAVSGNHVSQAVVHRLDVALGARSYPIVIGRALLERLPEFLPALRQPRIVVVTNPVVRRLWFAPLRESLEAAGVSVDAIEIADGEQHKSLATLEAVLAGLLERRVERSTTLLALGGGVVGDVAGFAAAVYQRGIDYVQVPTTLLAQVDSSVGGKTAVNHPLGKNMIGAFHQPRAVVIDTDTLASLPDRELRAGLAEVVKYGLIRDPAFLEWLETSIDALLAREPGALARAIERSCAIKAAIVGQDETESGERALLNFGHTFGHAIEAWAGYGQWLHGEAVATGMLLASRLSAQLGQIGAGDVARIERLLHRAGLPLTPPPIPADEFVDLMGRDKKVVGGELRFVLLRAIGDAHVARVDAEAVRRALG